MLKIDVVAVLFDRSLHQSQVKSSHQAKAKGVPLRNDGIDPLQ